MWIISIVLGLAKNIGIPLLQKAFPKFPQEVWDAIKQIISHVGDSPNPEAAKERAVAMHAAVKECRGMACPTDLKN